MKGGGAGKKGPWVKLLVITLIVGILAGAAGIQYSIDRTGAPEARWSRSGPFDSLRSFLDMLGGVRETLAAYLWTKTDDIFHEFEGGDPTRSKPLYPYFWLITKLDHRFTMAYYYASWFLCRFGQVEQGFDLALEGLRYNPYSPLLQKNIAQLYLFFKKEPLKARYHCLLALRFEKNKDEKKALERELELIDRIIAGERQIPRLSGNIKVEHGHEGEHHHEH